MSRVFHYWSSLNRKGWRLAGASTLLAALVLFLNNPVGSTWNHVGDVLFLVGMACLALVFWRKMA